MGSSRDVVVTTDDHDEDWFILARTGRTAESYHIQYEGYEPGDARAELILRAATDPIPGLIPRHAQLEDLQVLGFEILNPDPNGRCVRRNGRTFLEGHLESMVNELRDDAQEELWARSAIGNRTLPQKLMILPGHPPECIRLVPGSFACSIAAFLAVRITVRKCVGFYGLART